MVVIVWDGMRPDFVTEKTTPNLWKLARQGVTFRRHHPVYTSSTEVNGTAMATGVYPEHSGLMANREYRPEVDPLQSVGTELPATIQATKGDYLAVPTVVQILARRWDARPPWPAPREWRCSRIGLITGRPRRRGTP